MKVIIYDGLMDLMDRAESLGWVDTHPDASDDDYNDDVVDAIEQECIDFLRECDYNVFYED